MKISAMNKNWKKWLGYVGVIVFTILCSLFTVSCSEDEGGTEEFVNWKEQNDAAISQWAANSNLRKIRVYTQDDTSAGKNSDYIYVEVLAKGDGTESPIFTDTCRVAYRGRLLPSKSYKEGYVFDQSYLGDFDVRTMGVVDNASWVSGFATALQNMHIGDHWRVYIPYDLAYGSSENGTIPSYSNLIFDVYLCDFWSFSDKHHPKFKARER
jgi:FKBP-type peptidyl-prolyl cis-trans isomerase FklB